MTSLSVDERCAALGILPAYRDYTGQMRRSPDSTLEALLKRLSSPARTSALPPVFILRADAGPTSIPILRGPAANGCLHWEIETAEGTRLDGNVGEQEQAIPAPPSLPTGDHRLRLFAENSAASIAECQLIVAPSRAFLPSSLQGEGRVWGFAIQLFGLRSARNWGIGDFTDLAELIERAASLGAGIIGVNPLHTLFPDQPERASPYSPSSRNFLNFIYIDPEAITEFGECQEAQRLWNDPAFQAELAVLRTTDLVDYERVAACKLRILKLLFLDFRERHLLPGDAHGKEFREFQRSNDGDLRLLAVFQVLRLHLAARSPHHQPWWDWPIQFRHPTSPAILEFIQAHEAEIEFLEYQQWHARRQLRHCTERAQKVGMPIGLYQDIAIGVDRDSAEAWSSQDYLVDDWSIGAPPDAWSALGQNWGTPPPHPRRMAETGYAAFRRSLRANMAAAGAVRIDHAIGLMRLFWVPDGSTAAVGAFVLYPLDQLLAMVALESQNSRCLVIGEDLGLVPEGLQDALASSNILSYRLLYFERDEMGGFRQPGAWPAQALAATGTHDLPTLSSYWLGADIDLKARLGLYDSPDVPQEEQKRREDDREKLIEVLRAEGLEVSPNGAPIEAIYRHLARTPSKILMVQFEDLLGVKEQVNLPGTIDQHPNWRHKLPKTIADIFSDANVIGIAAAIRAERGNAAAGGTQ